MLSISSGELTAQINPMGAELSSIQTRNGAELMTNADPKFWAGRAPLLFPIVGRLHDDVARIYGGQYHMPQHGLARHQQFDVVHHGEDEITLQLRENDKSLAQYPFAFALDAYFKVAGATLYQKITVKNMGDGDMPFSFGFHPAFAWPLPFGAAKDVHEIIFEHDEPAQLCVISSEATIAHEMKDGPVKKDRFTPHDDMFANDALVWRELNSRSLIYGDAGGAHLAIDFPDTPWLGIWTKPGAAYLCIEPWAGMADPQGFTGDFTEKPGIMMLAKGEERSFRMDVTLKLG
ncbi:aldose epimerase [Sphingorhabdus lutea]|uniref:Aldose epimerase n=1 Tax=Sphingorhabdus lutea TaxID=1913578 RepID=A0A1L3J9Q8_9SPHN|nr:aldose 1-epimerase family protein [Sphingorhabdus lutea]APG61858.1 aldose epimerase [Sphingorhabdus lutea]